MTERHAFYVELAGFVFICLLVFGFAVFGAYRVFVMRRDLFVYISGPMTGKNGYTVEENVAAGLRVYLDCLALGIPAFSPHLSGAFPSAWSMLPWSVWLEYDYAVIDRCTHVLMMPRWQESAGAVEEHKYAERTGKPIIYSLNEIVNSDKVAS